MFKSEFLDKKRRWFEAKFGPDTWEDKWMAWLEANPDCPGEEDPPLEEPPEVQEEAEPPVAKSPAKPKPKTSKKKASKVGKT